MLILVWHWSWLPFSVISSSDRPIVIHSLHRNIIVLFKGQSVDQHYLLSYWSAQSNITLLSDLTVQCSCRRK